MNSKKFSEAMNEINSKYVEEAAYYKKRTSKNGWITWSAMAACLCVLVGGTVLYHNSNVPPSPGRGADVQPGGSVSEKIDPVISSLAVYPASEDIRDVENAVVEEIDETVAYTLADLSPYLPTKLPEGYTFGHANLYETTMKNGTKYCMLRVAYNSGSALAPPQNDREKAAAGETMGEGLVVFVMNYKPGTEKVIHDAADLTESTLEKIMANGTFHISYGEVYVGISPDNRQTAGDILTMIQSIHQ